MEFGVWTKKIRRAQLDALIPMFFLGESALAEDKNASFSWSYQVSPKKCVKGGGSERSTINPISYII